jgi:aminoglycoside phosphotransferase (APT) family kinase protein
MSANVEWKSETAPVRTGEELDHAALASYLRLQLGGASEIAIEQFPHGHSNLVYLVRFGGCQYVLRRPPLGPVAPKAHDMVREFRVLRAVNPHFPEAPRVVLLCEDPAVIGSTFFLMERRRGLVIRDAIPPQLAAIPDHASRISEAFIDCLARLHSIDVGVAGLGTLGRAEGFVERQVRGWAERWQRAKTEEAPEMDAVIRWLAERLPRTQGASLVHNDYKLDNVMLSADGGQVDGVRVEAVLDWEMATVGEPLADLGLTLCYWTWAPEAIENDSYASSALHRPHSGWFSRDEFLERYAARSGRDVSGVGYYEVLGVFKLAVILQQIYFRFHCGQTRDERFRDFNGQVRALARTAARLREINR